MGESVRCLRDFLVHFAHFCRYRYNDMCSFYLWKVLLTCMSHCNEEINWEDLIHVFGLNQWEMGDFGKIKLRSNWRESLIPKRKHNDHRGSQCSKQCHGTETVYYCFDCTKNPLYEICEDCFDESQHIGHRYTSRVVTRPEGKVCHCGDISSYNDPKKAFQCRIQSNNADIDVTNLQLYNDMWISTFSQVLDFIIDCCFAWMDGDEKIKHEDVESIPIKDSARNVESFSQKYVLVLYQHECNIHVQDVARKISRALKKDISFGTFVLSQFDQDEHFTVIAESTNKAFMLRLKQELELQDIPTHLMNESNVFKRYMISELVRWLHHFAVHNPSVLSGKLSLRLAYMDQYVSNLLAVKPFKINILGNFIVPHQKHNSFPWIKPWNFQSNSDETHDPNITNVMLIYDQKIRETDTPNTACRYLPLSGSRFQYFITECLTTFSQFTRMRLLEVFGSIFSVRDDSKKCLAAQYLDVYCNILYRTIVSDTSGYKLTLMSTLSQYIFPSPSTANMIINAGFIERCLTFSYSIMSSDSEIVPNSPPIPLSSEFKLPDTVIKNKKAVICFKDIYQAMCTNTKPESVFANESLTNAMRECFFSFNKILPLKRETSEHVQYENFDFSSFYFFFSSILIMVDGFLRNISLVLDPIKRKQLVSTLLTTSIDNYLSSLDKFRPLIPGNTSNTFKATVCNVQTRIFNFKVGSETQNFFNPISYYIKFILQWSQCGRYEPLPETLKNYFNFKDFFKSPTECLWIAEQALCTLVMISQIEVGFWVRNGSPIQHQLKMYTKYSMREFTYFSDFFHVQFSMCYADPHDFMVNFLTRWGLKYWAEGIPIGDYPEESLTIAMTEQCFLTLIRLMTETRALCASTSVEGFESTMKSEIIHSLCFRKCSYSSLVEAIPEHVTKHPAFDLYLNQYSDYHEPTGNFDTGTYSLKKQYRKQIDPFFVGFSSNKRYEATLLVRERMKETYGVSFNDTFVQASSIQDQLRNTQYQNLYQITSTDIFGVFVKNTLVHIMKMKLEPLLGKVLHLIHLCVVNNLADFERIFWHEYHFDESENGFYHSIGSLLYNFLSSDDFNVENGKIREIFRFLKDQAPHINVDDYLSEQTPNYDPRILFTDISESENEEYIKKKMLAKSRREKLMQKLAKQQKEFMDNNNVSAEDISSQGTNLDNSAIGICWTYPEDDCVFCKMPKDYDVLSYFIFVERNVVSINLASDDKTKDVEFQPVLTTCGHCAHFGCLLSHMKSLRKSLGQITKNIRDTFGLSSLNCSLCNSLVNAFIPLLKGTQYCADYNSKSLVTRHSLALITELSGLKFSLQNGFTAGYTLFANTISNLELVLRDESNKFVINKLTSRQITSLRLLDDLISFGLEKKMISASGSHSDDIFMSLCSSMHILSDDEHILHVLKTKLIEELSLRINEVAALSYQNDIPRPKISLSIPYRDVISQIIISRIHTTSVINQTEILKAESIFRENEMLFIDFIMVQFLIFLRKVCIALHSKYISADKAVISGKGYNELETMIDFCNLPPFIELLQELFCKNSSDTEGSGKCNIVTRKPKIPVFSPFIDLPRVISCMSKQTDSEISLRFSAFKEDIAICMFCGFSCILQKVSLLHFSRIGQCTNHYYNECKCKAPFGCFFILKSNIIYLSYGSRGSFYQTPYVNKHGETDEDYKLGTPVFFNKERYQHFIQDIILSGKIPHLINRANDKTVDVGGWESM
ncbi:Ubr2 [Kluyveromyces lactis]|nr:Ubr2 [Kluyveromyces lactis]